MSGLSSLSLTLAQVDEAPVAPSSPATETQTGPANTQTGTTQPSERPASGQTGTPSPFSGLILVAIFFVVMWVLILMPQRRERKKHAAMLAELKKGDRVQTIGGILGTVVEVRDREVIVKVDEASNARLRFTRSAIQGILGDDGKTA